jgi:hypothetical protein
MFLSQKPSTSLPGACRKLLVMIMRQQMEQMEQLRVRIKPKKVRNHGFLKMVDWRFASASTNFESKLFSN